MARDSLRLPLTLAVLACLFLLPSSLPAYELEKKVQAVTLPNGLRLLMLERHLSPTVSTYIRYRSGAVDEADGKTGTAHLLEHMMFKGTKTIGTKNYRQEEKLLRDLERAGTALDAERKKADKADPAVLERLIRRLRELQKLHRQFMISNEIDRLYTEQGAVDLNASTGQDLTTYKVSIPSNRLELWARIESDRMANPVFREFYTERDVVREERRQRSESDPDGRLLEQYLATAFIAHPYRRPVIGWPSDLDYLDMGYLRHFFKQTHAPNNTVIAVVGDIRPAEVRGLVEKYFGRIPPQKRDAVQVTKEPPQEGERRIEVLYAADPKVILGYHKPAPPAFDDYVFDVIEALLTQGRTARLYKSLVQEKRLATGVEANNGFPGARYANQFVLFATPRHPHTAGEVETALSEEIQRLKTEPVPASELEKVKNRIRVDFLRGLDSNAGLAGMLSYYEALLGDYRYLSSYTAAIDRITPEDIVAAARTYLKRENRTVAVGVRKQ